MEAIISIFLRYNMAPTIRKSCTMQWTQTSRKHATPIILKSILDVADPRAPTRGQTWANARYWTTILKMAGATVNRRLHGALVTFTSPESHLVSLSIQSLKKKSASERDEAESSARELSFGPDTHLYIPNWLTFTRELSFLERSGHQSTFFFFFFIFLFFFFFLVLFFFLNSIFKLDAE